MKTRMFFFGRLMLPAATLISFSGSAQGASQTWKAAPTDSNWATTSNWVGGAAPGATSGTTNGDTATFGSSSTTTVNTDASRNIKSITFTTGAAAYTIATGANTLQLTQGGTLGLDANAINTNQLVSGALNIAQIGTAGNYTFLNNSTGTGTLTISANVTSSGLSGRVGALILDGTNTGDNVFSGTFSHTPTSSSTMGITKNGTGTWTIGNASSYTAATTVNAGTLKLGIASAIPSGSATVINGGTLDIQTFTSSTSSIFVSGGILTGSSGVLTSTGQITLRSATVNANLAGAGTIVKNGAGTTATISGTDTNTGATTLSGGTLTLDYSTNNTSKLADAASLTLNGGNLGLSGGSHVEVVSATTLNAGQTSISGGASTLRMNAITRNAGGTINFSAASVADTDTAATNGVFGYATIGGANFATAASGGNQAITAGSSVTALPTTGGTSTVNYLQTDGASLTGAVAGNSLKIVAASASQTLNLGGSTLSLTSGGLLMTGANGYTISNGQLGAANAELIVHQYAGGALTVSGTVSSGTGSLTKAGTGTLILSSANTFSGQTTIGQGAVQLNAANALLNSTVALSPDTTNGLAFGTGIGTFTIGGLSSAAGSTNGGNIALTDGAGGITLQVGNNNATTTYDGVLSGTGGSLVKVGTGTLNLRSTSTYTGATVINAGTLALRQTNSFGTATGGQVLPNTALQLGGGTFDPWSQTGTSNNQAFTGTSLTGGASAVFVGGNQSNASGAVTFGTIARSAGATVDFTNGSRPSLAFSNSMTNSILGGYATTGNEWVITGAAALATYQTSTDGTVWAAADNVKLNASTTVNVPTKSANSLNFQTTTSTGQTLTQNAATVLTVTSGGVLASETTAATSATHTITGGKITSTNAANDLITYVNNAATSGTTTLDIQSVIQDTTSGMALTKSGAGTLLLSGQNTFTGAIYFNGGTIRLNNATALTAGTNILNFGNSTSVTGLFQLNGNSVTLGGLATNAFQIGSPVVENANAGSVVLTVNNSSSNTYAGVIQNGTGGGTLGLTKTGVGTQTLTNANTYSGTTTINAGTLALGASGSFASSPTIVVGDAGSSGAVLDLTAKSTGFTLASTQTLKGIGTVNYGAGKALINNGILAPGNSIGTLNITGDYSFGSTSTYQVETDATSSDKIAISGAASIVSGAAITFSGTTGLGNYVLATAASGLNSGTFTGTAPTDYTLKYSATELDLQHKATISLALGSNAANVHVGGQTLNLSIGNTAPSGSADLSYTLGGVTGSGTRTAGAGSSAATGSYTAVAGINSFNITASDAAATNSPQTVAFSQNGYNLAAAATTQTVNVGNFRVGTAKTAGVPLTNSAPVNATYTETLQTNGFSSTSANFTATGAVSGIAGGGTGSGTLLVGVGAGLGAGVQSGTTTLALQSNEVNGSGLGATSIGNQTITINATGYNPAAAAASQTVNLKTRVGVSVSTSLSLTNAGSASAPYQETLGSTGFTGTTSGYTAGGSITGLAGNASGSGSLTVGVDSGTVGSSGLYNGSTFLTLETQAVNGSGLGSLGIIGQTVNINVTAFDLATPGFSLVSGDPGVGLSGSGNTYTLNFGSGLVSGNTYTATISLANLLLGSSYKDSLNGTYSGGDSNGFTSGNAGSVSGLAAGSNDGSFTVTFSTGGTGNFTDSLVLNGTSIQSGLSNVPLGNYTINFTANVVPEPDVATLIGGVGMLFLLRRRRHG